MTTPLDLVGDTPLVELRQLQPRPGVRLFAKLEGQNPSGSIKDRVARYLVETAEARGELSPPQTLVEASSGNTAIALAMVARQRGYGLEVVLPERVPPSIGDTLALMGAGVQRCASRAGMRGAIEQAEAIAQRIGGYALRQFTDAGNPQVHYEQTGAEIVRQLPSVTVFVAGIGTGGTIMGVGRRLREHNPDVVVVGVEPKHGDCLQGLFRLEDAFPAPLLDLTQMDRRFIVDAAAALERVRQVARAEGLIVGVSAGATLHVALRVAESMQQADIVVMFSDSGWKYLPARPWDAAHRGDTTLDELHWW